MLQQTRIALEDNGEYRKRENHAQECLVPIVVPPVRKYQGDDCDRKQHRDERSNAPKRKTEAGGFSHKRGMIAWILVIRHCATILSFMSSQPICKSADHLFVPILEVSIPLLRCIHCDVFAYHETVKQLAKNQAYCVDDDEPRAVVVGPMPYWRRLWLIFKKRFA